MVRAFTCVLLTVLVLLTTACGSSEPPRQFANRDQFHAYVDALDAPDSWKEAIKRGTSRVSGKYINNMVDLLGLEGTDPIKGLLKKYGMKAGLSLDGIDPEPAIAAAVRDLVAAGDKRFMYDNSKWHSAEELNKGAWLTPDENLAVQARYAGEFEGTRRRSDIDPGSAPAEE